MVNNRESGKTNSVHYALKVALCTFFVACLLSANSQFVLTKITTPIISIILLVAVILVGIIFDIIGVSVTVADEAPLHSRASCRIRGATNALKLLRNADKVANFCCDVVGDICGTLSGGIGAAIIFSLPWGQNPDYSWFFTAMMSGIVASLTVGGKSLSKNFAINQSDRVIFQIGSLMAFWDSLFARKRSVNKKSKKKIKQ